MVADIVAVAVTDADHEVETDAELVMEGETVNEGERDRETEADLLGDGDGERVTALLTVITANIASTRSMPAMLLPSELA
jgi:hypothetical protein